MDYVSCCKHGETCHGASLHVNFICLCVFVFYVHLPRYKQPSIFIYLIGYQTQTNMKHKLLLMAMIAMLVGTFCSLTKKEIGFQMLSGTIIILNGIILDIQRGLQKHMKMFTIQYKYF